VYRLLGMLYKHKSWLLLLITTCVSRSIVVLFLNKGYTGLIDNVLMGKYNLIINSAILLLCTGIVQVIVILGQSLTASVLAEKVGFDLRSEAFEGILNTEFRTVEALSAGEILSKLNGNLSAVTAWVKGEFSALISDMTLFFIILSAMLYTNFKLTFISFFIVPFFSAGAYLLSKPITKAEVEKSKAVEEVNIIAKSIIDSFPIFKLFDMKQPILSKVNEKIDASIAAEKEANHVRAKLMSINGFLSYIPTVISLSLGGYMAINGTLTAGALLAFINMSGFVTGPLQNLPARINGIRTSTSNMSRLLDMLDKLNYEIKGEEAVLAHRSEDIAVEFRSVTFNYNENKNCIKDVSFKIYKGSKVAIVGESGCGKSTVLKLIAGLYPAEKGEINIFGTPLKNEYLMYVRSIISYVPQEAQLFPVSIYENITCGHEMEEERVMNACRASQLEELISSLPQGIKTDIGEQGSKLSGGERQRICIARAVAKDGALFLLDESTSALDAQREAAILKYFQAMDKSKTIISVTHKLANAVKADYIICMKNGEICETGTHEQLLKADNYYAGLYKLQNMLEVLSNEANKAAV
jgi:ATP-binding cassette, subfamily B, bacterial